MAEDNQDRPLTDAELAAVEPFRKLAVKAVKEDAEVEEYVNAASSSSARARGVIILLIIATVFLAVEVRNTFHPWHDARLELRKAALALFDREGDPEEVAAMSPDLRRRAEEFLKKNNLNPRSAQDKEMLTKDLDAYREVAVGEISYVHIPFVGAIFDGNDMALFAGLTFTVLLIWLRYSLLRELSNLRMLFGRKMSERDRRRCYDLVAMQQVLTVPRMIKPAAESPDAGAGAGERDRADDHPWRGIPKALYVFPPTIYALQWWFDLSSVPKAGADLGMGKAYFLLGASSAFLVLTVIFSIECVRILTYIDWEWDKAAKRTYGIEPKRPGKVVSFLLGYGQAAPAQPPPDAAKDAASGAAAAPKPAAPKADNKPAGQN